MRLCALWPVVQVADELVVGLLELLVVREVDVEATAEEGRRVLLALLLGSAG